MKLIFEEPSEHLTALLGQMDHIVEQFEFFGGTLILKDSLTRKFYVSIDNRLTDNKQLFLFNGTNKQFIDSNIYRGADDFRVFSTPQMDVLELLEITTDEINENTFQVQALYTSLITTDTNREIIALFSQTRGYEDNFILRNSFYADFLEVKYTLTPYDIFRGLFAKLGDEKLSAHFSSLNIEEQKQFIDLIVKSSLMFANLSIVYEKGIRMETRVTYRILFYIKRSFILDKINEAVSKNNLEDDERDFLMHKYEEAFKEQVAVKKGRFLR